MRSAFILSGLVALATAQSSTSTITPAAVVTGNPVGIVYTATLPKVASTNLQGSVVAQAAPNGVGVSIKVQASGFPSSGGPFLYHIHDQPVPADGNCTSTLGHLDPYMRGEVPDCDPTQPQTCQVGDLSGKHGKITTDPFSATYVDSYLSSSSTNKAFLGAFFGNRSVVFHFANKTRITCANFTLSSAPYVFNATSSPAPAGTGAPAKTTSSLPIFSAGAVANAASLGALAGGVAAALML